MSQHESSFSAQTPESGNWWSGTAESGVDRGATAVAEDGGACDAPTEPPADAAAWELDFKRQRLGDWLDRSNLGGVLLMKRANFAWLTGGRDSHVANNTATGRAALFARRDKVICLADSGEAPRMTDEVLTGTGIEVIDVPWWDRDAAAKLVADVMDGRNVVADADPFYMDLTRLPQDFAHLRWSLLPTEVERYRDGANRAVGAVERACVSMEYGLSEWEIAGLLDFHLHGCGLSPIATVVAADERVAKFRNPMPTGKKVDHYVMMAVCAEFGGLIICLTRFVSFRPMTEMGERQQAIADIDAAAILSTCPGRTIGEVFDAIEQAYAAAGYPMEWRNRPQGGATGYARREIVARPDSPIRIRPNQPFAWSPSLPGARGEDTIICTDAGVEVLTAPSETWPTLLGRHGGQTIRRADILVR